MSTKNKSGHEAKLERLIKECWHLDPASLSDENVHAVAFELNQAAELDYVLQKILATVGAGGRIELVTTPEGRIEVQRTPQAAFSFFKVAPGERLCEVLAGQHGDFSQQVFWRRLLKGRAVAFGYYDSGAKPIDIASKELVHEKMLSGVSARKCVDFYLALARITFNEACQGRLAAPIEIGSPVFDPKPAELMPADEAGYRAVDAMSWQTDVSTPVNGAARILWGALSAPNQESDVFEVFRECILGLHDLMPGHPEFSQVLEMDGAGTSILRSKIMRDSIGSVVIPANSVERKLMPSRAL